MKAFWKKLQNTKGSATEDLVLVVSIVLILGVLWFLSGGPDRLESGENSSDFSTGNSIFSRFDNFFTPITRDSADAESEVDQEYNQVIEEYGRVRDLGETSPYRGLVTIRKSSNGPKKTSPQDEYIILNVSSRLNEPLTITGWKLQSMVSNEIVTIPKATKISTSGNVNIEQPIVVSSQDKIYLLTGYSPTGNSFQINKCSGYFEQFQDFTPSISKRCPLPENELVFVESDPLRFGDACLTYIENLSRCYMPLEALPLGFPDSCVRFITEKINYSSCVKNHRNDEDFFKPEWRVYLKHDQEIWKARDIIRLLDENGKTVDAFNY